MTGYYDIVLGAIPLSLLGISGSLTFATDLALSTAVTLGALVAVALIGHAMFVNGPVDAPSLRTGNSSAESTPTTSVPDAE
ncbi:hypothetical protein [Halorubellus sp. PRR65]|uniref:hypothetical protein n=1 Tax=Halorubellus sp. PRR65 TaxID=3098148 RepID=UPI002B263C8D|nr:hypothetical protein [Halorubellus sp. PRR65]